jgi:hypothetical protein
MIITQHEGFEIISAGDRGPSATLIDGEIGAIFGNPIDAVDWAYDTQLGTDIPPYYEIKPKIGLYARLAEILLRSKLEESEGAANGKGN